MLAFGQARKTNQGEMMLYPKINSIYKRDPATNFKTFLPEYSEPEFELLADLPWEVTEKIDGTNIRVIWDGETVQFGGRTEAAQLPAKLVAHLRETFTAESFASQADAMILFGEGYGAGIQAVGGLYSPEQRFILFDVAVGGWWLRWPDVKDIAENFDTEIVPYLGTMTLAEAEHTVKVGFPSYLGTLGSNLQAEGLVLRAPLGLKNRAGGRIITKVKTADYSR